MRYIIYGVGAIGGTVAGALVRSGAEVIGIARGKMLDAIHSKGLRLRTPQFDETLSLSVVAEPGEIDFRADDAIFLAMKGQDTIAALQALRDAGVTTQTIICLQNGVENERTALRYFPNVYATTVMIPADYTTPGEVVCFGAPKHGMFDMGRYPRGTDEVLGGIAATLEAANFAVTVMEEVMPSKYGKLLENLGNVVEAALGHESKERKRFVDMAKAEAEAVYTAAGISWKAVDIGSPRRKGVMEPAPVAGVERAGGSSLQSLRRGTGSIETDYLNGEIALLGRVHGVATPINTRLQALGHRLIGNEAKPGSITAEELEAFLDAH